MFNVDDFIDDIFLTLDNYGIPSSLFAFILISIITSYLIYKLRKIDKNENIFKIMFSEKYNKDFGNLNDGTLNDLPSEYKNYITTKYKFFKNQMQNE